MRADSENRDNDDTIRAYKLNITSFIVGKKVHKIKLLKETKNPLTHFDEFEFINYSCY